MSSLQSLTDPIGESESQKVALGRALSFRPNLLCLDEPFSAMDEETREEHMAMLTTLKEKECLTIFHITHQMDEVQFLADRSYRRGN